MPLGAEEASHERRVLRDAELLADGTRVDLRVPAIDVDRVVHDADLGGVDAVISQRALDEVRDREHVIGALQAPRERARAAAVADVHVHEAARTGEPAQQHAVEGVALLLGAVQHVDALATNAPRESRETQRRVRAHQDPVRERGATLSPERWAEVYCPHGKRGDLGKCVHRWGVAAALPGGTSGLELELAAVEPAHDQGVNKGVRAESPL